MANYWSKVILASIFKIAHLNFTLKFMYPPFSKIALGAGIQEPKYTKELKG